MAPRPDPFEDVLNLEEQFYQEGYKQGLVDGVQAGKIEGRAFGLEKGYGKFLESGRLYGKSLVWANRVQQSRHQPRTETKTSDGSGPSAGGSAASVVHLPPLPDNPRLAQKIATVHALVEPDSLSTENTDEAVDDFDDRIKRAQGGAIIIEKLIERLTGERTGSKGTTTTSKAAAANLATEIQI